MKESFLTRTRDLIQKESRMPFFKRMDLYRIENGILIGVTGSLAMGFKLEPRDLLLQGDEVISDYEARMRKFINSLPEGAVIHFVVQTREGDEKLLQDYAQS